MSNRAKRAHQETEQIKEEWWDTTNAVVCDECAICACDETERRVAAILLVDVWYSFSVYLPHTLPALSTLNLLNIT